MVSSYFSKSHCCTFTDILFTTLFLLSIDIYEQASFDRGDDMVDHEEEGIMFLSNPIVNEDSINIDEARNLILDSTDHYDKINQDGKGPHPPCMSSP